VDFTPGLLDQSSPRPLTVHVALRKCGSRSTIGYPLGHLYSQMIYGMNWFSVSVVGEVSDSVFGTLLCGGVQEDGTESSTENNTRILTGSLTVGRADRFDSLCVSRFCISTQNRSSVDFASRDNPS
jgi:hypothetical protein